MWKSELRQSFPKLGNPHLSDREGQRCSEAVLEAGTLMSLKLRTCAHAIGLPELIFTAPGVFGRRLR